MLSKIIDILDFKIVLMLKIFRINTFPNIMWGKKEKRIEEVCEEAQESFNMH